MILPGTPSGRPCALAKTPARARKHCNFPLSPPRTHTSDNVHFSATLFPLPIHRPPKSCFCLLNTYFPRPEHCPPPFRRIHPSVSRSPTLAALISTASHNVRPAFPAAAPRCPVRPLSRIYQSFLIPTWRLAQRANQRTTPDPRIHSAPALSLKPVLGIAVVRLRFRRDSR